MKRQQSGFWLIVVSLIVLAVIFGPLAILWALNVISAEAKWGWSIPYNLATWAAALLLGGIFSVPSGGKS